MAIDPGTTPLIAQVTGKGHRIGAPDETNFEYGLDCILDHAGRLIEKSSSGAVPTTQGGQVNRSGRKNQVALGTLTAPAWLATFFVRRESHSPRGSPLDGAYPLPTSERLVRQCRLSRGGGQTFDAS